MIAPLAPALPPLGAGALRIPPNYLYGKNEKCPEKLTPSYRNAPRPPLGDWWRKRGAAFLRKTRRGQTIPTKFRSSRSPAAPLFSGWNWTPKTFLFATVDANGQIYCVVVSVNSGVVSA
ncbi:MAG: hypothetical protein A4E33_01489 [Methanoregula sp. PtaB.Bin085]|nr:MAG: hypothetical protein A4E33_01489 [Methanoregula sp. PtaB.Bin085]